MRKDLHLIIYNIVCAVVLLALLPLLTSCSDSGEIEPSGQGLFTEEQIQTMDQVETIRGVLNRLAGVKNLEDDFYQKTYEPIYGKVLDASNPFVRSVKADDSEFAYEQLELMVADKKLITPTADGYSVVFKYPSELAKIANKELFGKLIYHKGDETTRIAYVDVEIPNMPKLQRIDFVPSKLWGDNGIEDGDTTAFKMGELVYFDGKKIGSKVRGAGYWLCVREYNGQQDGILVHLNEGFDSRFAEYYGGDSDYSWSTYFEANEEDTRAYMAFLYEWSELMDLNKDFLQSKSEWAGVYEICPARFLENGNVYDGDKPAWIVTDTHDGGNHYWFFKNWTVCEHLEIPAHSKNGRGEYSGWYYDYGRDWKEQRGKCYVYTINAIRFSNTAPKEIKSQYNPAAHYE